MKDNQVKFYLLDLPKSSKVAKKEHLLKIGINNAGTVFVPAALIASDMEVFMRTLYDGEVVEHCYLKGHLYIDASWAAADFKEQKDLQELLKVMSETVKRWHQQEKA
jgi:hypothetical protein